ncbi:MAG: hypothetical protein AAGF45_04625 [Pseudomonadota bacterium]
MPLLRTLAIAAVLSVAFTGFAAAEWRFNPDRGNNGQAVSEGENRTRFLIDCGPGGIGMFLFRRTELTGEMAAVIAVDGNRIGGRLTCDAQTCQFSPETGDEALALGQNLRRGETARLRAAGSLVDSYSLRGSARAIDALRDRTQCRI